MNLLEVRDLTVAFPPSSRKKKEEEALKGIVLDKISFDMKKGEVLGLVGESGSGKSMTSLAITGLLPDAAVLAEGEIVFEATDLLKISEREMRKKYRGKRISTIFQDAKGTFVPSKSVGPQIAEMFQLHEGMKKKEAREKALELLRQASISDPEGSYDKIISEFSGGEAQRASIAMMALATKPDLLIADEATTALDVTVQKRTLDYLMSVVCDKGISLLFITHDFGLIAEYTDRVVVLDKGKVVERGKTEDVFADPRSTFLKNVLANIPRMDKPLRRKTSQTEFSGTVFEVSNLSVSFSTEESAGFFKKTIKTNHAVDDVSLNLNDGEILGIVGESGSGKTTLMRSVLNTLVDRAERNGEVSVFGKDVYSLSIKELMSVRRAITGVPQSSAQGLTPGKRVRDIVGEPLDIHNLYEAKTMRDRYNEKLDRVADLLRTVELSSERMHEVIGRFSGGEQQRVAIASALATDPSVLFLDEPTASLDASRKNTVLELLIRLHEERNLSLVIISHELATVASVCDRVIVMQNGKIVEEGSPEHVFGHPNHPYTQELVSSIPTPEIG
ncbi:MAG: ABC transporter ATP-binding protein [Candidatus Spechtbacterales bacterium]